MVTGLDMDLNEQLANLREKRFRSVQFSEEYLIILRN